MSNMTDLWLSGVFFQALNVPKLVFRRGGALPRNPLGNLRRSSRPPSRLGMGHPFPYPSLLDAFGVSISAPSALRLSGPEHKFLATPMTE